MIFYLAKGWRAEHGGLLVDHATGAANVPVFNSLGERTLAIIFTAFASCFHCRSVP